MNRPAQPRVSVVIPLYNNAEYLSECIESVLSQSYQNWDCTIVNNRSTDGSSEIAHGYAKRDARVRVCDNRRFLPALENHNAALRLISPESKYCKMVFADDWLFPECLERMVFLAEQYPSVGIVGAYVLAGGDVKCVGLPYTVAVVGGREVCRAHLLNGVFLFWSANALLYRADLVRKHEPFFNEANVHADTEVCFELLKTCDFGFVHELLTCTRVREGSRNAKTSEIQTNLAGWLQVLVGHGSDYLNAAELKTCLDEHMATHYRYLGKKALLGEGGEFWRYHKTKLIEAEVGFSWYRVARGALATVMDYALTPRVAFEKLLARRRRDAERGAKGDVVGPPL